MPCVLVERVLPGEAGVQEDKIRVMVRTRVGSGWLTGCRAGQENGLTIKTPKGKLEAAWVILMMGGVRGAMSET